MKQNKSLNECFFGVCVFLLFFLSGKAISDVCQLCLHRGFHSGNVNQGKHSRYVAAVNQGKHSRYVAAVIALLTAEMFLLVAENKL